MHMIRRILPAILFVVGGLLVLVALAAAVTNLEAYIDPQSARDKQGFVQTLAQIAGGAALLIGLYFTRKTVLVNQEGQVTERFTKAIDQLGASEGNDKRLEIRLGGIYALGRIARDSEKDYWPIMEVLTAYVREHAPWPPRKGSPENTSKNAAPDIQAILNVIGRPRRHGAWAEPTHVFLSSTDLRFANLQDAHLEAVDLHGAHLGLADLQRTRLNKADLYEARLEGADLQEAHLEEADLTLAHLEGANLSRAYLNKADFYGAHLEGVNFQGAHLLEASLEGAHLEGADLRQLDLTTLAQPQRLKQEQIQRAIGDDETDLPIHLSRPKWWQLALPKAGRLEPGE
jgi:Pentapeptide repeats (8 copies)